MTVIYLRHSSCSNKHTSILTKRRLTTN